MGRIANPMIDYGYGAYFTYRCGPNTLFEFVLPIGVGLPLGKYEDSNEWRPNVVEVWKTSRTKSNGTWSVPNGEEIMVLRDNFKGPREDSSLSRNRSFKETAQAALDKQAVEIKQIFAHLASNQGFQNMLSNASPSTTSSEE
nr:putative transposase [Ipomoea batatas]